MPIVALRAYILLRFAPGACFRRKNIKTENAIDFLGCVFFCVIFGYFDFGADFSACACFFSSSASSGNFFLRSSHMMSAVCSAP